MMAKEEEKPKFKKIGIFHVVWSEEGKGRAFLNIGKKILEKWEELGYNIRDLDVIIEMEEESGILIIAPLTPPQVIEAMMEGWRIVSSSKEAEHQDEKKEVR
jgi:tripartite-type tricarboxylate transporter receptor subunit TctC